MEPLRIQNYLQFHNLIVVSKIVKNKKHRKKVCIFGDHRMISVLYEFFYNSPNSHNLIQIKVYHYQNSLLKKKNRNYSYHSKSDESIISGTCLYSFFCSHFFHLSFLRVGPATLSISLSLKRPLYKLVNG